MLEPTHHPLVFHTYPTSILQTYELLYLKNLSLVYFRILNQESRTCLRILRTKRVPKRKFPRPPPFPDVQGTHCRTLDREVARPDPYTDGYCYTFIYAQVWVSTEAMRGLDPHPPSPGRRGERAAPLYRRLLPVADVS